jgi:hypothetical protein
MEQLARGLYQKLSEVFLHCMAVMINESNNIFFEKASRPVFHNVRHFRTGDGPDCNAPNDSCGFTRKQGYLKFSSPYS